jgi:hypothetical protein
MYEEILKIKQDVEYINTRTLQDNKSKMQYFFYLKKEKIVYELMERRYLIKTDLKREDLPKHIPGYTIPRNFVYAVFSQLRGYVYKKDNWDYSINLVCSPYFKNNRNLRILHFHDLFGNNIQHQLKVDGQIVETFTYYKTRVAPILLIDNFVKNYCIPAKAVGFKNICPSMFKQMDIIKRNAGMEIKNKEDLMIALTLKKLLK